MGWLDIPEKRRKQHLQLIATGNIKDVDRIQQRERKRRWFILLDIILVVSILIGIAFIYYNRDYGSGGIFIIIGLVIIAYFILRKRKKRNFHRPRKNNHRRR